MVVRSRGVPCSLNTIQQIWWLYFPHFVVITVKHHQRETYSAKPGEILTDSELIVSSLIRMYSVSMTENALRKRWITHYGLYRRMIVSRWLLMQITLPLSKAFNPHCFQQRSISHCFLRGRYRVYINGVNETGVRKQLERLFYISARTNVRPDSVMYILLL